MEAFTSTEILVINCIFMAMSAFVIYYSWKYNEYNKKKKKKR